MTHPYTGIVTHAYTEIVTRPSVEFVTYSDMEIVTRKSMEIVTHKSVKFLTGSYGDRGSPIYGVMTRLSVEIMTQSLHGDRDSSIHL